jgi:hypothetical protein
VKCVRAVFIAKSQLLRISLVHFLDAVVLNLENNFLSGQIPASLGNAGPLVELRLNNNLLEGVIPASLGNLSSLGKFQCSISWIES